MSPSVGRIVHYRRGLDGPCLAAVITEVGLMPTDYVALLVLVPRSVPFDVDAREAIGTEGGRWHWPERV